MTQFDNQALDNLKKLCRIECTPEEMEELRERLKKVLQYIKQLDEIDTDGVAPCTHVLPMILKGFSRKDEEGELLAREVFLANAPDQIGGMIRVPPVLKESP
jgi:aspartyl-tRNA(Asn)/glutamyl-tRNA(Gln) amidotransferase subunit C